LVLRSSVDVYNLHCMLAPEQSRAARAWLEWSQEDLAIRAQVSLSTVRDFEKGRRVPIKNNLDAIEKALSSAGVALLFGAAGEPAGINVAMPAGQSNG
jgi:ribosome-binding protein aMBF1 (putative translation factor)